MRPNDRLLVNDGKIELRVLDVDTEDVHCEVIHGGPVSDNKGISLPGVAVSVPPLSEKDIEDLKFALELGVDMGLSWDKLQEWNPRLIFGPCRSASTPTARPRSAAIRRTVS